MSLVVSASLSLSEAASEEVPTTVAPTKAARGGSEVAGDSSTDSNNGGSWFASIANWAKWSGQIGILNYTETDRIQAIEPAIALKAKFSEDRVWSSKIVLDSLTGPSPNGALTANQPQTFTSPSGKSNYQIKSEELPLEGNFKDTRVAISSSWAAPIAKNIAYEVGINGSSEYDFFSLGLSASLSWELNQKNTILNFGASYEQDEIDPVGGAPIELATMVPSASAQPKQLGNKEKTVSDILVGVSQVINRKFIVQANYSLGQSEGYLNDPYKLVTVADGNVGSNFGDVDHYIYEKRPDKRLKQSVYFGGKYHFERDVLSLAYRYFFDDWGINSHSIDFSYVWEFSTKWKLQPNFRLYMQSAADFYKSSIRTTDPLPSEVSADARLGEFNAYTPGIKLLRTIVGESGSESELGFSLQYYLQKPVSNNGFGSQSEVEILPDVEAFIVRMIYSF